MTIFESELKVKLEPRCVLRRTLQCSLTQASKRVKKGLGEMFHVGRKTLEFDEKQSEQTAEDSKAISSFDNMQPTRCCSSALSEFHH